VEQFWRMVRLWIWDPWCRFWIWCERRLVPEDPLAKRTRLVRRFSMLPQHVPEKDVLCVHAL